VGKPPRQNPSCSRHWTPLRKLSFPPLIFLPALFASWRVRVFLRRLILASPFYHSVFPFPFGPHIRGADGPSRMFPLSGISRTSFRLTIFTTSSNVGLFYALPSRGAFSPFSLLQMKHPHFLRRVQLLPEQITTPQFSMLPLPLGPISHVYRLL